MSSPPPCDSTDSEGRLSYKPLQAKRFDPNKASSLLTPLTPYPAQITKAIAIIYTGGTIGLIQEGASAPTKDPNFVKSVMEHTPLFRHKDMPKYVLYTVPVQRDSALIQQRDWRYIADAVFEIYEYFKAFVIIHGTDTLSYTASALSFMFEHLQKHVVLTGAQLPLSAAYSDGYFNLAGAMLCASQLQIPEVTLFFANKLFRANRTTKSSSWQIAAFDSALMRPMAEFGQQLVFSHDLVRNFKEPGYLESDFCVSDISENVGVVYLIPGLRGEVLKPFSAYRGLILQVFGAGNGGEAEFCQELKRLHDSGCCIAVVSQTHSGKVSIGTYEASNQLKNAGAISSKGMTIECAFAKMGYLLAKGYAQKQVEELFCQNIRGEIDC